MADPWSDDLAALGEHTRHGLRSLAATRASLSIPEQETKMRFFKSHPALATLIALAVLGLAAPIAYAVARDVWVSIDPDQPAPQIEQSIHDQLQQQGVNATVHADKTDGKLRVRIESTDPSAGSDDVHVHIAGGDPAHGERREVRVEVHCKLDDAQRTRLQQTLASEDLQSLLEDRPADESDDELADRITAALAEHGFAQVHVTVQGDAVTIAIAAPPAAR